MRQECLDVVFGSFLFPTTFFFSFELATDKLHIYTAMLDVLQKVLPQFFCLFCVLFWPCGVFSSSGLVGLPLPRFPCVFPSVLGWGGGAFLFCLPLASCISSVGLS